MAISVSGAVTWYGYHWWTVGRFIECTDDAYVGGDVTAISRHVSGFGADIAVTGNERIRAGQLLVRLDARDYRGALNLGDAVGITVSVAVINDQTSLHFLMITSRLTPANDVMKRCVHGVAGRHAAVPSSLGAGHTAELKQLWLLVYREASTLAYADAFRAIMLASMLQRLWCRSCAQ